MQVSFNINKVSISTLIVVVVFLACFTTAAYASYNTFNTSGSMVVDESNFVITDLNRGDGPLTDFVLTDISPNDVMEFSFEVDNNYANPIEVRLTYTLTYTGGAIDGSNLDVSWREPGPAGSVFTDTSVTCTVADNRAEDFYLDVVAPNDVKPGTYDIEINGMRV